MYSTKLILTLVFLFSLPPPAAALDACSHIHEQVGLPAVIETGEPAAAATMICRQGYVLSYNHTTKVSDWVMQRVAGDDLEGTAERKYSRFKVDPALTRAPQATLADYRGSGYDRGHLAPAADFARSQSAMDESFYLSNIAPQVGVGFNRGIWKRLETATRTWARARQSLVVMTGPVFFDMTPTIGPGRVVVPDGFFKIIYDPPKSEALAFYFPNQATAAKDMAGFQVTVRHLEAVTGFDFFKKLSPDHQARMESARAPIWK